MFIFLGFCLVVASVAIGCKGIDSNMLTLGLEVANKNLVSTFSSIVVNVGSRICVKQFSLHQYVSRFTLCFTIFWMKLDKFTMMKVGNPWVNGD